MGVLALAFEKALAFYLTAFEAKAWLDLGVSDAASVSATSARSSLGLG